MRCNTGLNMDVWKKVTVFILISLACILVLCGIPKPKVYAKGIFGNKEDNTGYSSILYNSQNGLPTSEANTIVQTSDGFIWIGCYSGLIRYDGNKFYRFDSTTGITSVVSLFIDSKDRLWIGTNDKGIALYNNGGFTFYGKEQGLRSLAVKDIAEDGDGNIIIGTTSGTAYINQDLELQAMKDNSLNSEYICDLDTDADGNIIGVTLDGDIFQINATSVIKIYDYSNFSFSNVGSVYADANVSGLAYFGTDEDIIIKMNLNQSIEDYEIISAKPLTAINKIELMENGDLWVCSDSGMGYLDSKGNFTEISGVVMNNSIDDMMIDYEGNMWFASSRQGVMKIVKNRFKNISLAAGLPDMVVNTTSMYKGELHIGTDNGLYVLDDNYNTVDNELTELLTGIRIRCITQDSLGNLWLCTYGDNGLVKYDSQGNITAITEKNGLNSNRVRAVIETKNKDMVVSSSGGVNIIRGDRVIESYNAEDGIENTEILTVCEGENGVIYAGSDGGGIYVIEDGTVSCINQEDGLESDIILRIKKDPIRAGHWIITGNSIAYMLDNKCSTITNFSYSNNFDLFFFGDNIWILSSNGIYVVNGEELMQNGEINETFYNVDDGMPSNVTANSRSYINNDGILYISGSSKVFSIDINQSDEKSTPVRLSIPMVAIDNEIRYLKKGEKLVIPDNCKRLTIYGYVLTYTLQDPKVEYFLEGFDEEGYITSKSYFEPVSYTNLKGGEYTFHLIVHNSETGDIDNEIYLQFEKEKTIWETAWSFAIFIFLIILASVFAGFIYVRIRNKALVKKHEENKVFINQVIRAFAKTIDVKDNYTKGHSFRVAEYATMIAEKMNYTREQMEDLHNIALLHDIGKVAVPDAILKKKGKLSDDEFTIMKQHTSAGYDILAEINSFPEISLGARYHHERIDGKGYPSGIVNKDIPEIARIIAVADTFDAMNSTRPYRNKLPIEHIVEELKRVSGIQLDAEIVSIMLELIEEGRFTNEADMTSDM